MWRACAGTRRGCLPSTVAASGARHESSSVAGRTLALLAFIVPLLALFVYVGLRSGPLAPVTVTLATVESRASRRPCSASARWRPVTRTGSAQTVAGRVERLDVDVGDRVGAGQVLGAMDSCRSG